MNYTLELKDIDELVITISALRAAQHRMRHKNESLVAKARGETLDRQENDMLKISHFSFHALAGILKRLEPLEQAEREKPNRTSYAFEKAFARSQEEK